jgi:N-acetylglucosaminyl-diphospho-decaprenol L-rhamnosyltransferase
MVTYHSRDHVLGFLANLPADIPLAVVDNSQGADDLEETLRGRPHTRYLPGPAKGFATAANIAASTSRAEYLVFVNPDSRPTLATIEALLEDLRASPGVGAIAATMIGPDGRTEHSAGGWEVSVPRALVHALGFHKLFRRAGLFARPDPGEKYDVDWVTGACMVVPRKVFEEVGGFDQRYFVYSEDVDFGHRLRSAGYRVRLRTNLLVPHNAGSSGGGSLEMQRLKGASFSVYARQRLGASRAAVIVTMMTTGFLARTVVCRLTGRRVTADEHLAYIRGLVFGTGTLPGAAKSE